MGLVHDRENASSERDTGISVDKDVVVLEAMKWLSTVAYMSARRLKRSVKRGM